MYWKGQSGRIIFNTISATRDNWKSPRKRIPMLEIALVMMIRIPYSLRLTVSIICSLTLTGFIVAYRPKLHKSHCRLCHHVRDIQRTWISTNITDCLRMSLCHIFLMVDANFIFILVFVSSYFCLILRMRHGLFFILFFKLFIYNVLPLLYTFSSCSSHIVNTFYLVFFFFKFLHPEFGS